MKAVYITLGVMKVGKNILNGQPDGVQRGLIGEITARFEKKGFRLVGAKLMHVSRETADSITVSIKNVLFW